MSVEGLNTPNDNISRRKFLTDMLRGGALLTLGGGITSLVDTRNFSPRVIDSETKEFCEKNFSIIGNSDLENARIIGMGDIHSTITDDAKYIMLLQKILKPGDIILLEGYNDSADQDVKKMYALLIPDNISKNSIKIEGWDDTDLVKRGLEIIDSIDKLNKKIKKNTAEGERYIKRLENANPANLSVVLKYHSESNKLHKETQKLYEEKQKLIDEFKEIVQKRDKLLICCLEKKKNSLGFNNKIFVMAGEDHFNNKPLLDLLSSTKYILLNNIDSDEITAEHLKEMENLLRENIPLSRIPEILRQRGN